MAKLMSPNDTEIRFVFEMVQHRTEAEGWRMNGDHLEFDHIIDNSAIYETAEVYKEDGRIPVQDEYYDEFYLDECTFVED